MCIRDRLGTDFFFSLLNNGIQPKQFLDEFVERFKYVNDFHDIMACAQTETLFHSLIENDKLIRAQSTSLALKLNGAKLRILPEIYFSSK